MGIESAGVKTDELGGLVARIADRPAALVQLARTLVTKGDLQHAQELCTRALILAPDDPEVHTLARDVLGYGVKEWYFAMLSDHARHLQYERAFARAIHPGDLVLDIGSATGLFAMMAARAGAERIFSCEKNPSVAAAAAAVVDRNGYAERIQIIRKLSLDIRIGADIPRKADVLIWDNLANNLIGAGALQSLEHAFRWLLAPGARVIPARGTLQVALADDPRLARHRAGIVEGFDLTPFNRAAQATYIVNTDHVRLRSASTELFAFDFASGKPLPSRRTLVELRATGGLVSGVLQWLTLEIDDHEHYDNGPPADPNSAFGAVFYPALRPIDTEEGQTLTVRATHDRKTVQIWIDER